MEKEQIEELVRKASLHDHDAQITLGEYYYNMPTYSNSNFTRAEKYLRMAAEKHNEKAIQLLIFLYTKYMEYFIQEKKKPTQIGMCFRLGVKWCKIGNEIGYNFIDQQNKLVEIFSSASEQNNKIDLNFRYKKAFRKNRNIIFVLMTLFLAIFILFLSLPPLRSTHLWILPACCEVVSLGLLCLNYYFIARLLKNKKISSYVVKQAEIEKVEQKQEQQFTSGMPLLMKLKKIFNYDNVEEKNLDGIQRGLLGECFIEYLNGKKAKVLYQGVQKKLDHYSLKLKKIEWINRGVESNDPFDFIITTEDDKKIYMDVKTSWNETNSIYMSYIQKQFYEKVMQNDSTYIICRINNFWYKNVDDFKKIAKNIRISFIDLKIEEEKNKLNIIFHTSNAKK